MMRNVIWMAIAAMMIMLSSPLQAAEKKPDSKLKEIEAKVAAEKAEQEALKSKASQIEEDMKGLKSDLITTTAKVQTHENNMRDIEDRLAEVTQQKNTLTENLTRDKKSLSDLILALERIRRLPPETLIARPDAPLQTAQAATVLASILPEVNRRAEKLKTSLMEIQLLENTLIADQDKLKATMEDLKKDQSRMNKLVADRSQTLKSTKTAMSAQEEKIASLSREAKNFRDLIAAIQKRQDEERARERTAKPRHQRIAPPEADNEVAEANLPALGTGRPPVSGIIKTRYGQKDEIGAISQGVIFQSRPGAVVVAPLGGTVRYAGDFRNYGRIILLEHKNKFHSLVAGLGKIDTFVGQRVDAGEPLGYLPSDSGRLYYELRKQGDPVNPSQKFSNLN